MLVPSFGCVISSWPQPIDLTPWQMVGLALVFIALTFCAIANQEAFAAVLRDLFLSRPRERVWLRGGVAAFLAALVLRLAVKERGS